MASARLLDWPGLAADYAQYHRHPMNRLCHALGIPLILFCLIRWTQWPGTPWPVLAVFLPLYAAWDLPLGFAMTGVVAAMALAAARLPAVAFPPLFLAGWALQFVGHWRYEKRSPAFTKNGLHLLVGPLWILRESGVEKLLR